jgi:hypothetical protein
MPTEYTVPAASRPEERFAAEQRLREFPFRFPNSHLRLGGSYTVAKNAQILQRCCHLHRRLSHGLGSWTLGIPEFEVKIETGRHIFWHMDAARELRQRLVEQERRLDQIDGFRDVELDQVIDEALSASDAAELLVGLHLVIGQGLITTYRQHLARTCPIADAPTLRVIRRILIDLEPMVAWAEQAVAAYVSGGWDESRLMRLRWHLEQALAAIGGISGAEPRHATAPVLKVSTVPYVRGTVPMRDSRFVSFKHTGDYQAADGTPRHLTDSYEAVRLGFIRTQRDEVDAIEAFGTFLWDARFVDFEAEYKLARITWDEARHTELGHQAMLAMGYNPFELPNRLTSSTCRGPMDVDTAFAEINLFGEVSVMKTINTYHESAIAQGDTLVAHVMDFVRADERTHVRNGQYILKHLTTLNMKQLELKTREVFTECLIGLGAVTRPQGDAQFVLSREEIEHLVGE